MQEELRSDSASIHFNGSYAKFKVQVYKSPEMLLCSCFNKSWILQMTQTLKSAALKLQTFIFKVECPDAPHPLALLHQDEHWIRASLPHVFPSLASFSESKILVPDVQISRVTMFVALNKFGINCGFCSTSCLVNSQSVPKPPTPAKREISGVQE